MKMTTKNKKLFISIILICGFILLICGFYIGRLTINKNSAECLNNPLAYSIKALEDLNKANFTCSCSSFDSNLDSFYFDDEGMYKENPLLFGED